MLFRSEEAVDAWCEQRGVARGEVLALPRLWELSQLWYHNRLSPEYHGRTAAQVQEIFRQLGLTSSFWQTQGDLSAPQK